MPTFPHTSFVIRHAFLGALCGLALGCQRDIVTQPIAEASTLFWKLEAQEPAIVLSVMAPYDTVQLKAVPKTARGESIPTSEPVTFRRLVETDSSILIDAQGLVTAKTTTVRTQVEVSMTIGSVTRADTIIIMVRPDVQLIDSVDFAPLPPDSTWRWAGSLISGPSTFEMLGWVRLYDAGGTPISTSNVVMDFTWNDNAVFGCEYTGAQGFCSAFLRSRNQALLGETYIKARTYAFGKVVVDSFLFTRVEPTAKHVIIRAVRPTDGTPAMGFYPSVLTVRPGTTVFFINRGIDTTIIGGVSDYIKVQQFVNSAVRYVDSVDVTFDDPSRVEPADYYGYLEQFEWLYYMNWEEYEFPPDGNGGNIDAFGYKACKAFTTPNDGCGGLGIGLFDAGWRSRKFTQPGTYHYHSTRFPGLQGTIIVRE